MAALQGDRRALLSAIRDTDKKITGIYERAAEQLARKAGAAKAGELTERWLRDYERSLREVVGEMQRALDGAIRSGAEVGARLPVDATAQWLGDAARRVGLDDSFRRTLTSAPTDAMRAMLTGRMYSDGKTLSKRIWAEAGRLQGGIEEVVAQGIAQKRSAFQVAKDLEAFVNPNAKEPYEWNKVYKSIPFPLYVDYNAQRLARTAINHAYWGANKEAAKLNPLCQGMQWLLSPSHIARQVLPFGPDICDAYAEHDEGLGIGVYPIDELPMPHPQCLCTQVQVVPEMDAAVDRLNRWLDGGHDPALTRGFGEWRGENVARAPAGDKRRFMADGRLRIVNRTGAPIDREVIEEIEKTGERLTGAFPILNQLVNRLYVQPEKGVAAFGTGIDPRSGAFESGIALDTGAWKSMRSIRAILDSALACGHTKGTDDPMFIFSHEVGHALHTALALQDIGYAPGGVMTPAQDAAYRAARDAIAQEVFREVSTFRLEQYDTAEKIFDAIEREMGYRGSHDGAEFIAQSVALVYNGHEEHPIADDVLRWLKRRLR